jgi:hypothetical protein
MCGRIAGTILITAARTSRHGGICCLKKILAETNKHYCTMQRLKHWLS